MSLRRRSETRLATILCSLCDVTWRGRTNDECWSCGDASAVAEAAPRAVRYSPARVEDQRLVG